MAKRAVRSRSLASTASRSSLPPSNRHLVVLKHTGAVPSKPFSSNKTLAFPNLSICHACGTGTRPFKGKTQLQTLASQWRVVLLCPKCRLLVESSDICSYCFSKVSISASDGIDCRCCNRRIHRHCISFVPPSDSFTCVDCWVPKSRHGLNGASQNPPRKAVRKRHCPWPLLEDVVKDVSRSVEKAVATAGRARERAATKAAAARQATELARSALGMAVLASRAEGRPSGTSVLNDKELAVRLHRAINSSPRISKFLGLRDSNFVAAPKKQRCDGSDLDGYSICGKDKGGTDDKLSEKPDQMDWESSFSFSALDRSSSIKLDTMGAKTGVNGKMTALADKGMENIAEHGGAKSFKRGAEEGLVEKFFEEDEKLELPMKEEQGSCSNKVVNSSEDDNSVEYGSESCQMHNGLKDLVSSKFSGILSQPGDDGNSSNMQKKRCCEPGRYLITYSKRRTRE